MEPTERENTMDNEDNVTELTLRGAELAAKVFGLAVPAVNALGVLIEAVNDRRTKHQIQRLEKLVKSVCERLDGCENKIFEPFDQHLIDEILAKAVMDEDESKTDFYAALVEYSVSGDRNPYEVRLLVEAFKNLTIHEIEGFAHFNKHEALRHDIPEELEEIFWDRVLYLGLHQRGKVGRPEYTTLLGQKFLEVCKLSRSTLGKE